MAANRLDRALRRLDERFPAESARMSLLARELFARDGAFAENLEPEALVALVADAYRFLARAEAPVRGRVRNPSAESGVRETIVETNLEDRPFVVDTIRIFLHDLELVPKLVAHPIFGIERDAEGKLLDFGRASGGKRRESYVFCAVERAGDADLARLEEELRVRLEELVLATDDHRAMLERLARVREQIAGDRRAPASPEDDVEETLAFLRWLAEGGFVFLGARSYTLVREDGRDALEVDRGSGLGILRREERSTYARRRHLDELPQDVAARVAGGPLLTIARTNAESRVHRRAQMDYVGLKRLDAGGRVVGEHRFLGLFTSKAYAEPASVTPLLRRKLERLLAAEQAVPDSHDWKQIVAIFDSIPKTELLTLGIEELRADVRTILSIERNEEIRVTFRADALGRGVSAMVVLPRDRFSGEIRREVQSLLEERLGGRVLDYQLALGEGDQARLHFYLVTPAAVPVLRPAEVEREIAELVRTWADRFLERVLRERPGAEGRSLVERWIGLLDREYQATTDLETALVDLEHLERLSGPGETRVVATNRLGDAGEAFTTIRVYRRGERLILSDFLPILENFGFRVFEEDSIDLVRGEDRWFLDRFRVRTPAGGVLDVERHGEAVAAAILAVHEGRLESDPLNRLVIYAGLAGREVDLLRTYRNLAFQLRAAPSRAALTGVLVSRPDASRALFDLFDARLRPDLAEREKAEAAAHARFTSALEAVETAGDDRMLRTFLALVEATVRTTFFRPLRAEHPSIAIKVRSQEFEIVPKPRPLFEVYVHSARMEGCHLRSGRVARGGIRWSDRHDDFRTEILGLMKTQTVKNAVIVPAGAKGGFIVKRSTRGEDGAAEVRECYSTLIRGLLDLTDDVRQGEIRPPEGVVRRDEDDPYLVVAADKGTATFSDLANSIAEGVGFWLGDAFASGGSQGYDHKKEGITARGAWECVRHHFRELGKDVDRDPIDVAGIGDMSGDVFGNGMLLSRSIRLRAAFNHLHVFLDPAPDAERSFRERERLFALPRSQWTDYAKEALGPGGAIVARSAKSVALSAEAKAMLGVGDERIDGEALVRAVLRMETDLLYNGGIGTYVRASTETNAEVGDAANDAVRIPASELRARVVGEGGNLGFTQRARVEAALRSVRLDTDAIDNSAGVDLSDHEVNLKILFRPLLESGKASPVLRNRILEQVKPDVIRHVLEHNRRQAWLLSIDQRRSRTRLVEFRELMTELEAEGLLDRALETLPTREAFAARRGQFLGLARPELAVVVAYAKISLQRRLLASTRLDDSYLDRFLVAYFPPLVGERYGEAAAAHRLRREIVSSELVNQTVDRMGACFAPRLARLAGVEAASAVAAYALVLGLTDADRVWEAITRAPVRVEDAEEACLRWESAIESACRFLLDLPGALDSLAERVERWARPVADAADRLERSLADAAAAAAAAEVARFEGMGFDPGIARSLVSLDGVRSSLEAVVVAERSGRGLDEAVEAYAGVGALAPFAEVEQSLVRHPSDDRWEQRAAAAVREDVAAARRSLALAILAGDGGSVGERLAAFATRRGGSLAKLEALGEDLRSGRKPSLAGTVVLAREITKLAAEGA